MQTAEALFHKIAAETPNAKEGKMFGALCIKAPNGKSGAMLWHGDIVVKLTGEDRDRAMKLKGAKLFEPMAGRAMKEWVQLPIAHASKWKGLVEIAMDHVRLLK